MNWVDITILALMCWFTYSAFHTGLIREIITIVGAIFAVVLAGALYLNLATDVGVAVKDDQTARVIAFGMIFGATVLASQLLAIFLKQAASLLMLGIFDALGGALIGFAKGFIFVEIALMVGITFTSLHVNDSIKGSEFAPFFLDFLPILKHLLPEQFKIAIDAY